ncbi:MAG: exopolyphosphatase [Cytophagales bacterium]
MRTQKIAIIDLGTNTFHLLVAERSTGKFTIVYEEKLPAKIGVGGINQGLITADAIERAISILKSYRQTVDEMGITEVLAFGTSAIRSAKNRDEVVAKIAAATGFFVKVITGDDEASYIYKGVRAAVNLGYQKSLIVDIGGGSVEFIIANESEVFWKQSFEIGGQRLLEQFQQHDPILPDEVVALHLYLAAQLQPLLIALKEHKPETLVGSSGTFDTLSEIHCYRNGIVFEPKPEIPLTLQAIEEIYEELLVKNRAERLSIPGMIALRVDMIVVACALLDFLLKSHSFEKVRVSSYSLKEGVLQELSTQF